MILKQKETTVSYRCPTCGAAVTSMVGAFSLGGDMFRLKCPCGESALTVTYASDGRMTFSVPCFLCPNPHTFTLTSDMFFSRELFAYSCPYSGIDICFTGTGEKVKSAMDASTRELEKMLEDVSIEQLSNAGKEKLTDPQVLDIVTFVIQDLQNEGHIHCYCENGGDYHVEIEDDHVLVLCKKCGAMRRVPTDSTLSAHAFLTCDDLFLE